MESFHVERVFLVDIVLSSAPDTIQEVPGCNFIDTDRNSGSKYLEGTKYANRPLHKLAASLGIALRRL